MTNTFDIHTLVLSVLGALGSGKILLMLVRSMPPPPASCGFWCRWCYDFLQLTAENQDKVGKSQAAGQPIGVEQPTATLSKSVLEISAVSAAPPPGASGIPNGPVAQKV